jgi:hypothetical protein
MKAKANEAGLLKSFEDLGEVMKPEKKFFNSPIGTCEPVALSRLVEIIGNQTKVGKMIGVSGSHISACLKANETRLSYELAAKAVLIEMERESTRPTFYFVEVRSAQQEVFDAFLRGMNLKATTL